MAKDGRKSSVSPTTCRTRPFRQRLPDDVRERKMWSTSVILISVVIMIGCYAPAQAVDYATRYKCADQFFHAQHSNPSSSRLARAMQKRYATAPWSPERLRLGATSEGQALIRAAARYCAARGQ